MADTTQKLDLAQRIAEAVNRTTEPLPTTKGMTFTEGQQIVGAVPTHLRHLHNLMVEQAKAVGVVEAQLNAMMCEMDTLHTVFFSSVEEHITKPEGATGLTVLDTWDVAANFRNEEDGNPLNMLAALLGESMKARRG